MCGSNNKMMTIKKYITLALTTLVFTGCTNDDDVNKSSGMEHMPLTFETNLSDSRSVTRAIGSEFETGDVLQCYIRHIYSSDLSTDKDYQEASTYKKLVTINKDGEPTEEQYWDDYSDSDSQENDLRTDNHALQSYYGYCYNGGTPSTALVEATGVLGWTTAADQTADGAMKANDLLWSAAQEPVTYTHAKESRSGLSIPYSHAMSKFTIVVVAGEGFKTGDLDATSVTLSGMNEKGTFTAPTATVTATGTTTVKMFANATSTTTDSKPCRAYEAVAVPQTSLASGQLLATIQNVNGNNYQVNLSNEILSNWASGIDNGVSISGVNYKLTVTLNKQEISIVATLADWTDVSATGTGEICFSADVTMIDKDNSNSLKNDDCFSLWMTEDLANLGDIATTATYNGTTFVNTPAIYWPNGSDKFFFRALAQKTDTKTLDAITTNEITQGTDLLWGTTAAHTGTEADNTTTHNYAEGVAINPRTGDVPLIFKHVMSNVVIDLQTTTDAAKVDLTGATITLTKLTKDGNIDIATGKITLGSTIGDITASGENMMVPQTITDNTKLIVTLLDGTTYSRLLNLCEDSSDNAIDTWTSGNKYTYTITLKKEEVTFRVLVQDWSENTGSGNATLDWD